MTHELTTSAAYRQWLSDLKTRFRQVQLKAAVAVNTELLQFYWELGADIVARQVSQSWGSGFIENLSHDLMQEFPEVKGFSVRNLKYIRQWRSFWSGAAIGQQAVAQLIAIPWGHSLAVISKCRNHTEALFCVYYRSPDAARVMPLARPAAVPGGIRGAWHGKRAGRRHPGFRPATSAPVQPSAGGLHPGYLGTTPSTLLRQHIPEAEVWAYGSRVRGDFFDASDLDLVARFPDTETRDVFRLSSVVEAFVESNLPIIVQVVDWDGIPQSFRDEILVGYVVVQKGAGDGQ